LKVLDFNPTLAEIDLYLDLDRPIGEKNVRFGSIKNVRFWGHS